ncbi:MAG: cell division protein FtsQ [Alphaproteobacteria bacterium]|nr:cell division protein FtsQ [Alphaproteobacteria bacterium]
MSAKIARGSPSRARPKGKAQSKGKKGKAPVGPFSELVRRFSWWIFMGVLAAVVLATLFAFRIPQLIGTNIGEGVGGLGFTVKRVEIKGLEHMERLPIYAVALDQQSMAMPLVDLQGTRSRLMAFGWVREARVTRRLPDTLVVDIVERKPAAIWQHNQQLALIDMDGIVLDPVRVEAMPDLPIVIGPDANLHAGELARLVAGAPQLKPLMAGATWVGGRRWDLRFQSGETLSLPEGDISAQRALASFTRIDQATGLLGKGFLRFDMRIPGKMVTRLSGPPPASAAPLKPAPPAAAPADNDDGVDTSKTI